VKSATQAPKKRFPVNPAQAAVFILVVLTGLFFRSYDFHLKRTPGPEAYRHAVEAFVTQQIRGQIEAGFPPGGNAQERKAAIDQKLKDVLRSDHSQFESAVEKMLAQAVSSSRPRYGRRYLLEADPYHYMDQTHEILRTGRVSDRMEHNKYFDPLRVVPKGFWTPISLHPYLGAMVYRIASFFGERDLMTVLGFVPLFLLPVITAAYFLLGASLGFGLPAVGISSLALVMAPVFLQRSSYGWYDTDPYNVLFPALILACFFSALKARDLQKTTLWALGAGLATGLYPLFWVGWPFIFFITAGAAAGMSFLGRLQRSFRNPAAWRFFLVYAVAATLAAIISSTPAGFVEFIARGATFIGRFSSTHQEAWPNIFLTVGETNALGLKRFFYLTGNPVTWIFLTLLGIGLGGFRLFFRQDKTLFLKWLTIVLMLASLSFLSFRTERFALLVALPAAVLVGFGVQHLLESAEAVLCGRFRFSPKLLAGVLIALFLVLLLPLQLFFAHALALKSEPIMDDAWYEAMMRLNKDTPENSVIYNWWPPGYFITSLAERRIVADGGTQHLPECYWSARFFMSEDEKEARGILRMHVHSGNDAVNFLEKQGMPVWKAMSLVNSLLPLNRTEAEAFLEGHLPPEQARELLDKTHSTEPDPPVYIFVYNEMLEKNIAMSILARWNFKKAAERSSGTENVENGHNPKKRKDALLDILSLSDRILKYRPESALAHQEGSELHFTNGLVVNLDTFESRVRLPSEGVVGQPQSLFLIRDGRLDEIPNTKDLLDVSALVYREKDGYASVLADRELIRSMLYRLYYLRGEGLDHFTPFFETSDAGTGNVIRVFRFDPNPEEGAS